jgi:hypothetical protein
MNFRILLGGTVAAATLVASQLAQAGGPIPCNNSKSSVACLAPTATVIGAPAGKRKTDEFFVGINWNFGSSGPELVLGARSVRMNASGRGDGARLDFTFPFSGGISFDKIRLSYVNGHNSAMGEFGFGYSFLQKTPFVTGAIQAPYLQLGVDYLFSGKFMPFVGVNTLKKPKAATSGTGSTTLSCAPGDGTLRTTSSLLTEDFVSVAPEDAIDGQTCFTDNND